MSFSSGNTDYPQPGQQPLGLAPERLDTAQQGRVLPVVYGRQRIGVTFITQPFNQGYLEVKRDAKDEDITIGYYYYCAFAALVCHGPVDAIHAIYFDDVMVWEGPVSRGVGEDYITITVTGYGSWRFYWGTETQTIDPLLATLATGAVVEPNVAEDHPAYAGQCYLVSLNQNLGYNRTNVPNIEVIVSRNPEFAWLTPAAIGNDVNLANAIVEAMTNTRYGLGLVDTDLDQTGIEATRAQLATEELGLSPIIDRGQPFDQVLLQILAYFDAWYASTNDGKITLGLSREITGAGLPVIDETCLTDLPEIEIPSPALAKNDIRLSYTNSQADYKPDALAANSAGNLQTLGNPNQQALDRPWITTHDLADKVARIAAKALSLPQITGTLKIRKSKLQGLTLGGGFYITYAGYGLTQLPCRCTAIDYSDPHTPEATIQFEVDRGYLYAQTYTPAAYTPPPQANPYPHDFTQIRLIEMPSQNQGGNVSQNDAKFPCLAVLASRPTAMTIAAAIYVAPAGVLDYRYVTTIGAFAIHATLDSAMTEDDNGPISITVDSEFDDMPDEIDEPDPTGLYWLLFVDDEIMAFWSPTLTAPGQYTITIDREKLDTIREVHAAGAEIYMITWGRLKAASFTPQIPFNLGDTINCKAQAIAGKRAVELADVSVI
ncbi:MAG: hypothetical protein M1608_17440, partial [Candidatus Omnitrophica bacterium]|nr:hypothetical protein [Candidatus Omnitrophota bacterium]